MQSGDQRKNPIHITHMGSVTQDSTTSTTKVLLDYNHLVRPSATNTDASIEIAGIPMYGTYLKYHAGALNVRGGIETAGKLLVNQPGTIVVDGDVKAGAMILISSKDVHIIFKKYVDESISFLGQYELEVTFQTMPSQKLIRSLQELSHIKLVLEENPHAASNSTALPTQPTATISQEPHRELHFTNNVKFLSDNFSGRIDIPGTLITDGSFSLNHKGRRN